MNFHYVIASTIIFLMACSEYTEKTAEPRLTVSRVMSDLDNSGFSKVLEKRQFNFPEDHGAHSDFRTEWWYFTGNVTTQNEKKFGYQFTIFRTGLSQTKTNRFSDWNSNQIYMAHFALTDISEEKFYFRERFSRDGNLLAGTQINPFKVWQEDWQVIQIGEKKINDLPELNIVVQSKEVGIDFNLKSLKPIVLQGDQGLSQKGKQPGNASYYYSYTRLQTKGRIIIEGEEYRVTGHSWMDREWSTSALSEDQQGWDWFALQLEDHTEIMYYQMRKTDGSPDMYSKGVIVEQDGRTQKMTVDHVVLEVLDRWQTPSGLSYPSGWRLKIPSQNINLEIIPAIKNQFLDVSVKYWEGSVSVSGIKDGFIVTGRGYVELTGY
jgi:predicted secreted hydrolase